MSGRRRRVGARVADLDFGLCRGGDILGKGIIEWTRTTG